MISTVVAVQESYGLKNIKETAVQDWHELNIKETGGNQSAPFWAADPKGTISYRTKGGISVHPSERTSERPSERPSGRPLRVQPPPPDPSPSTLSRPQPPTPLETLPRPQLPYSRPPATPPSPRTHLPIESPCPHPHCSFLLLSSRWEDAK